MVVDPVGADTVSCMSSSCNDRPTINGSKGAVYALVDGGAVRIRRSDLLSGFLPEDMIVSYGHTGRTTPGAEELKAAAQTTVKQARAALGAVSAGATTGTYKPVAGGLQYLEPPASRVVVAEFETEIERVGNVEINPTLAGRPQRSRYVYESGRVVRHKPEGGSSIESGPTTTSFTHTGFVSKKDLEALKAAFEAGQGRGEGGVLVGIEYMDSELNVEMFRQLHRGGRSYKEAFELAGGRIKTRTIVPDTVPEVGKHPFEWNDTGNTHHAGNRVVSLKHRTERGTRWTYKPGSLQANTYAMVEQDTEVVVRDGGEAKTVVATAGDAILVDQDGAVRVVRGDEMIPMDADGSGNAAIMNPPLRPNTQYERARKIVRGRT